MPSPEKLLRFLLRICLMIIASGIIVACSLIPGTVHNVTSTTVAATSIPRWKSANIITYHGHSDSVDAIAWSPDGKQIASVDGNGVFAIWNPATGTSILTFSGGQNLQLGGRVSIAWSPDGTKLAAAGPGRMFQVWDVRVHKQLLHGSPERIYGNNDVGKMSWSPDGTKLAIDGPDKTLHVWEITTGKLLLAYSTPNGVSEAVWSPDSSRLISLEVESFDGSNDHSNVHVWDVMTDKLLLTYYNEVPVLNVMWIPYSNDVVSELMNHDVSPLVHIWDASTGENIYSMHYAVLADERVENAPDGKHAAILGCDHYLCNLTLWDVKTGQAGITSTWNRPSQMNSEMTWSPDNTKIAIIFADIEIRVWNAHTNTLLFSYKLDHSNDREARVGISLLIWSPDSQWIVCGDEYAFLFDVATRRKVYTYSDMITPRRWSDLLLAWSSDGTHIASSFGTTTVQVWDAP